ncbi:Trank1 [Symbiodinium sp. CCMP2592]|nr:Trank1 [Symbiodinium sp. CCMP2592]
MMEMLCHKLPRETHRFRDVREIWGNPIEAQETFDALPSYEARVEWAREKLCQETAWCDTHGGYCCIQTSAQVRTGGFPCIDWSGIGKKKYFDGPMLSTAFAFGAKARTARSPCVCVENVEQCPETLVHDAFGDDYEWTVNTVVDPSCVGFEHISRTRTDFMAAVLWGRYMVGRNINETEEIQDASFMLQYIQHCCQRDLPLPDDVLLATPKEVALDASHLAASSRQGKRVFSGCGSDHSILLSSEQKRLRVYRDMYMEAPHPKPPIREVVCHLGDNPEAGFVNWSLKSGKWPTLRRAGSLYYALGLRRHVTLQEMYLAMGFPTHAVACQCSYLSTEMPTVQPGCSWFDARRALGNSMCVPNVGTVAAAGLMCLRRKTVPLPLSELLAKIDGHTA